MFPYVIETQVKVWENSKLRGDTRPTRSSVFPLQFLVLPNFHSCFYNCTEIRKTFQIMLCINWLYIILIVYPMKMVFYLFCFRFKRWRSWIKFSKLKQQKFTFGSQSLANFGRLQYYIQSVWKNSDLKIENDSVLNGARWNVVCRVPPGSYAPGWVTGSCWFATWSLE